MGKEHSMATATAEREDYQRAAERIFAKLPKAVRDKAELKPGGGAYTLLKYGGRTVASIRGKNVRLTIGHDGTPESLDALAPTVAEAAKSRPEVVKKAKKEEGDDE